MVIEDHGKPIQIAHCKENGTVVVEWDKLAGVLTQNGTSESRGFAVLTVIGPPQYYKTFILNYMMRFEEGGETAWMKAKNPSQPLSGFPLNFNQEKSHLAGYSGISIWSKPFSIDHNSGKPLEVFLLDYCNNIDSELLKCLALCISSSVVFIIQDEIEEKHLQDISNCYNRLKAASSLTFNQGSFLIFKNEAKVKPAFNDAGANFILNKAVKKLDMEELFGRFTSSYVPNVAQTNLTEPFNGAFSQLNPNFVSCFGKFATALLSEILEPKKHIGVQVTTTLLRLLKGSFHSLTSLVQTEIFFMSSSLEKSFGTPENKVPRLRTASSPVPPFHPGSPITKSKIEDPEKAKVPTEKSSTTLPSSKQAYDVHEKHVQNSELPSMNLIQNSEFQVPACSKFKYENEKPHTRTDEVVEQMHMDVSLNTTKNEVKVETDQEFGKMDMKIEVPRVEILVSLDDEQYKTMENIRADVLREYEYLLTKYFNQTNIEFDEGGKENHDMKTHVLSGFESKMAEQKIPVSKDALNALKNGFRNKWKELKKKPQKEKPEINEREKEQRIKSEVMNHVLNRLREKFTNYIKSLCTMPTEEDVSKRKQSFMDSCRDISRSTWFEKSDKQDITKEVWDDLMGNCLATLEKLFSEYLGYLNAVNSINMNDIIQQYAAIMLPELKISLTSTTLKICDGTFKTIHEQAQIAAFKLTKTDLIAIRQKLPAYFKAHVVDQIELTCSVFKKICVGIFHYTEALETEFRKNRCFTDGEFLKMQGMCFKKISWAACPPIECQLKKFVQDCTSPITKRYSEDNKIIRNHENQIGDAAMGQVLSFHNEQMKKFCTSGIYTENQVREYHNRLKLATIEVFKKACDFKKESGLMIEFERALIPEFDEVLEKTLNCNNTRLKLAVEKLSVLQKIRKAEYIAQMRERLKNGSMPTDKLRRVHDEILDTQSLLLAIDAQTYVGNAIKGEQDKLRKLVIKDFDKFKQENDKKLEEEKIREEERRKREAEEAEAKRKADEERDAKRRAREAQKREKEKQEELRKEQEDRHRRELESQKKEKEERAKLQKMGEENKKKLEEASRRLNIEEPNSSDNSDLITFKSSTQETYTPGPGQSFLEVQETSNTFKVPELICIEFGLTYFKVATRIDGEIRLIPDEEGQTIISNVIGFRGDEIFVGKKAEENCQTKIKFVDILEKHVDDNTKSFMFNMHDCKLRFEEVLGLVFCKIRQNIRTFFKANIPNAIITIPVWLNSAQRQGLKDAGTIAGFQTVRIVSELTASAFNFKASEVNQCITHVVILSVDDKSFDTTLYEYEKKNVKVKKSSGLFHPNLNSGFSINPFALLKRVMSSAESRLVEGIIEYVMKGNKQIDTVIVLNNSQPYSRQLNNILKFLPPSIVQYFPASTFVIEGAFKYIDALCNEIKLNESTVYQAEFQRLDKKMFTIHKSDKSLPLNSQWFDPGFDPNSSTATNIIIYETVSDGTSPVKEYAIVPASNGHENGKFKVSFVISDEGIIKMKAQYGKNAAICSELGPNLTSETLEQTKYKVEQLSKVGFRNVALDDAISNLHDVQQRAKDIISSPNSSKQVVIKERLQTLIKEAAELLRNPVLEKKMIENIIQRILVYIDKCEK